MPENSSRAPVSAVIITRDAASQLPACLASLDFVDEIVVVDSGSRDTTCDIAREAGARLVLQDWLGFGPQKQFAVGQARNDWVLCLDADERVSPALRADLCRVLASPRQRSYRMARCNRFLGRWLRHGEGYPDWSLRLFDRRAARWSDDAVHERVLGEAPPGTLTGDLLHESAETLSDYFAKQNRYTSLQAQALVASGRRIHAGHLLLSPLLRFVKFYLLRRGFLDGLPGLIHILIGCGNSFAKYAKAIEIRRCPPA